MRYLIFIKHAGGLRMNLQPEICKAETLFVYNKKINMNQHRKNVVESIRDYCICNFSIVKKTDDRSDTKY